MLDIKYIRDNADSLKKAIAAKQLNPKIVDEVLRVDEERRQLIGAVEELRQQINEHAAKLKGGKPSDEDIDIGRKLKAKLQDVEPQLNKIEEMFFDFMYRIPNPAFSDVPVGRDESENVVVKQVGEPTKFDFVPKDHLEIGRDLDIIDTETATTITGSRFGYLKGGAALLEFALIQYVMSILTNTEKIKQIVDSVKPGYHARPFVPVVPPVMIRPDIFKRMARLSEADKDERYYLPQDDLYLIGSAEHTLGPMYVDKTLPEKSLPLRYIGFSTSFRREAGSYGKDTKGILRVHQFDKLEMESFTLPEDSRTEQDFLIAVQEYLVSGLKIPYQLISICTGDMGKPDARQMDINCWLPGQNKFRETHTSDLMTDYQARRLNTKVRRKDGSTEYLHMNDATAIAIGRMIIAIIENYQQADGTVKVPDVLVPFMGKEVIGFAPPKPEAKGGRAD